MIQGSVKPSQGVGEMSELKLPDWVYKTETHQPSGGRDYFISRSLLRVLDVLLRLRAQSRRPAGLRPGWLLFVLVLTVLVVSARTQVFLFTVLAGILVLLCLRPGEESLRIVRQALAAAFVSALLLLPSLWLGGGRALLLIPGKTFLTVSALGLLVEGTSWHALTASLRLFHVPPLFIQILDFTLKYIVVLGEIAGQMLWALKLRAVGEIRHKSRAVSGVLGATFLKSQQLSQDMYEAMLCRGFTGQYPSGRDRHWRGQDAGLVLAAILVVAFYLYVEGVIG